tara:strand:+ start:978 stop:2408 length:1431 start_codon:yes stop_codon:yes gene_type:complete
MKNPFNSITLKKYFSIYFLRYNLVLLLYLNLFSFNAQSSYSETNFYDSLFVQWNSTLEENHRALALSCPKIDTVRIAVIGLGNRGQSALSRLPNIPGVKIIAIADIDTNKVNDLHEKYFKNYQYKKPVKYYGKEDWKVICQRNDIDLIYVCTHWELHSPIAIYAMKNDKHVAVEVPAAMTVKDCWKLVKTAEKTRKHCIQLENCIYDFFEITVLNMSQNNLFGDLVHAEGAYIHDLRALNFSSTYYWNQWRLKNLQKTNGNTYPTHGLGPLAHLLGIHRGDKMTHLVSMSSNQYGLTKYAKENFESENNWNGNSFEKGDMNTTLIRTHKGKTIMLQHDVTSPRPYSRLFTISGTKGFVQKYPIKSMAFDPKAHRSINSEDINDTLLKYEPTVIKQIKDTAKKIGGHGGMDYIMDYRLIYCLRNGLPLDQDVYDAAEWSSIVELSKKSVNKGSKPIDIPDFTKGNWNLFHKVNYYLK